MQAKLLLIVFSLISIETIFANFETNEINSGDNLIPIVITTWGNPDFVAAGKTAWWTLLRNGTALDAVESGCSVCETLQCDRTVGFGGSPDESGETTLDSMIMDGDTMNVGGVTDLRRVKQAISVARHVLEYTTHSILAGDQATQFAVKMGFKEETLQTSESKQMWNKWKTNSCQPNSWINVTPDSRTSCGPYTPIKFNRMKSWKGAVANEYNHDTIGMVAIDSKNRIVAGTSTNGLKFKIPGRVSDSPIPGAGAYADSEVGGAAATGDGDIMLRFLPTFLTVELMRNGQSPEQAARTAIKRIKSKYPLFNGAIVALNKLGEYGAACSGFDKFPFTVYNGGKPFRTIFCH